MQYILILMDIMVHCKSCEIFRLLKTSLVGRDIFFGRLSGLPITMYLQDFSHQLGLF